MCVTTSPGFPPLVVSIVITLLSLGGCITCIVFQILQPQLLGWSIGIAILGMVFICFLFITFIIYKRTLSDGYN